MIITNAYGITYWRMDEPVFTCEGTMLFANIPSTDLNACECIGLVVLVLGFMEVSIV